ncbi:ketosynthase chain-length factor [Micromonospora maris]|uniref:Beta-ketoacyl synthase n=1 Tax=Micromonospora maris TaxID=1003110 RepID=A0A9X0HZW8_9ACTN|nr:ketosynthase chain-length factor [Micromonospora maris]AEB44736.1 3-oxoacyl-(acyl-carrier-protein) synthase [Micromonospora maris AB-18-032]KUJ44220.1 beta-ketoacyl synthase [Micromonospora maris]
MSTAVVTGLGVLAPTGCTVADHWSSVLAGRSALAGITLFDASAYPTRVAGTVAGFAAHEHVPGRLVPQTDRWTHFGLAAAAQALDDAALDPAALPEYEMGVVTASSSGGTEFGQREIEALWRDGPGHVGAYQSIAWFYAATTGQISIRHGMRGPCGVLVTEQAGGLDAIGQARRLVRGGLRTVVTGGTDASLCPYGLVAQLSSRRLSPGTDPARAYVPFDADAAGHVPGEGGGMLIVEEAGAAAERGARRYGVVAGYAATFDPPPGSARPSALGRAITAALADAGLRPGRIGAVFADAAAVPELDRQEAAAIAGVFGPYGVPVTAPKTMTGRLYAGGAALDLVTALLALRDGVIPPTTGVRHPLDELRLDLVCDRPRQADLEHVLVLGRGIGGFNAAVVLSR